MSSCERWALCCWLLGSRLLQSESAMGSECACGLAVDGTISLSGELMVMG